MIGVTILCSKVVWPIISVYLTDGSLCRLNLWNYIIFIGMTYPFQNVHHTSCVDIQYFVRSRPPYRSGNSVILLNNVAVAAYLITELWLLFKLQMNGKRQTVVVYMKIIDAGVQHPVVIQWFIFYVLWQPCCRYIYIPFTFYFFFAYQSFNFWYD